jgi:hypothetical protein
LEISYTQDRTSSKIEPGIKAQAQSRKAQASKGQEKGKKRKCPQQRLKLAPSLV